MRASTVRMKSLALDFRVFRNYLTFLLQRLYPTLSGASQISVPFCSDLV